MAVIDEVSTAARDGIGDDVLDWFRSVTAVKMWEWYDEHRDEVIFEVGVWFLKYRVRIRDVKQLFVILFGARTRWLG